MLETLLLVFTILSGLVMLASGAWLVIETFVLFRTHMTQSLNSTLDVIKVVKPKKADGGQAEGRQAQEKEEIAKMEQLLSSLSDLPASKDIIHRILYGDPLLVFEMAVPSDSEQITFFVSFPRKFQGMVEKQIHSFFPNAHIEKVKDYSIFRPGSATVGSHLRFKKKDSFPIKTYQRLEVDPLHSITNALSKLEDSQEGAAIQIVLKKSTASWRTRSDQIAQKMQQGTRLKDASSNSVLKDVAKDIGGEMKGVVTGSKQKPEDGIQPNKTEPVVLTPEDQDIIKQLETKANKAHFDANIRLLASAPVKERAEIILSELENAFVQFEDVNLNKFIAVRDSGKNARKLAHNFIFRDFENKQRVILDTEEVVSVFHLPISTTETPKIDWMKSKTAPPPANIPKEGLLLGYSDFRGTKTDIRLDKDDRRRHLYIIGQTGTGKSTFIEEMAKQDTKKDGMCVIDPHGDLIDNILGSIPKERSEDVIYFDPSDTERPFALNMMEYDENKPEQKTFVINETLTIFDKLYDLRSTGGPMFEQYMRNAMLLSMDSPELGSTMMEIPRIFRDTEFRKKKLAKCKDMIVVDFWQKEAEKAGGDASLENIAPYITSKLTTFISNDMMRPIIAQQKSTIDFRAVMDEGKILLVNLSKGKIGEINSHLLGMVIVGKLLMAALSRVDMDEKERKDFYLYIDEFQNFTTDSISQILAEARKYRLSLIIAHQFIGQLSEGISKAVFGNVGSLCSFRVGSEDAVMLEKQFAPTFDDSDLINADNYNCFTKLLINSESSAPFNMKTYPPSEGSEEIRDALKELSRFKYGRDREVIEDEIKQRYNL
ncbi:MAG: type IV secretion system DNA-binding domain-containing protein [Patescibacteria group bacterium]|nr:type IV secretion system DNA-binding domain-containing protein [Patescibacteria group bacterium]